MRRVNNNKLIFRSLAALLLIFFTLRLIILISTFQQTPQKGIATDLRNRIVGTRIALLGHDPYTYVWSRNESERYLDPLVHPLAKHSRLTITPAALLLHLPISYLMFSQAVNLWYYFQWACLVVSGLLLVLASNNTKIKIIIGLIVLMFGGSSIWQVHLFLGQLYILFVLILSFVIFMISKNKLFPAFAFLGFLALARPTYTLVLISFFVISKFRRYLNSALLYMLIIFGLTVISFNNYIWMQYFNSMKAFSNSSNSIVSRHFDPQTAYPTLIENWAITTTQTDFNLELENSIRGVVSRSINFQIPSFYWFVVIGAVNVFFLIHIRRLSNHDPMHLLFLSTVGSIFTEYLLPTRRYIYSDIQWIIPIALLIIISSKKLRIQN